MAAAAVPLRPGPIFAQLLMADEINRASPKTQSALLQAMQEHHVTALASGTMFPHVPCARQQNPLEQEGPIRCPRPARTLPAADRRGISDQGAERACCSPPRAPRELRVEQIISAQELQSVQRLVRQLPVPDKVVEAILRLVRSARPGTGAGADTDRLIAWGPGPRASQALMLAVRAKALIDGRLAPSLDDVAALAEPVLKHRMALTFAARAEGESASGVINRLAAALG